MKSADEMIADIRLVGTAADNPAVRAFAKITAAMLEEAQNLLSRQDDARESLINTLRLRGAVEELAAIAPDVWMRWVDADQQSVVADFRAQVESTLAAWRHAASRQSES